LQGNYSEQDENWKIREWLRCQTSPEYFARTYCYLQDRAKKSTIKFEAWPHLIDLLKLFLKEKLIIILKARQLGISWLMAIYAVWMARFYENVKVLMLSQGEEEAFDLISKCRFIDDHLPDFIKTHREPDQRGFIGFPATNSEIKALPSTEKAGRSTDATIVICDEWEYHPYAEANFAALKPTIDAGGQFIGLSTADKTKLNTFFKAKYNEALQGDSGFKPVFLSWHLRPGRTLEWFAEITKDLRSWQVEQEYPETEQQALSTLKSRKFFGEFVEALYGDVMQPLSHELSDKYSGLVRIYRLPVVGRTYCLFTDPSDGKDDPHATIVIDAITGEEMAESHGKCPADQVAEIHDALVRLYNNAFNAYEINATAGGHFDSKIKELGTPNQCRRLNTDGKLHDKLYGWYTGSNLKRKAIWGLEEAVRLRQIIPHSRECLDEFSQYMQPEGEEPQPPKGGHDDYIDAWGRVLLLRNYAPVGGMKITHLKYG